MSKENLHEQSITENLANTIEWEIGRIEKYNPQDKILEITCTENGKFNSAIGKNNSEIRFSFRFVDENYLMELLAKKNIQIQVGYTKTRQIKSIHFVKDNRTEEEIYQAMPLEVVEESVEETTEELYNAEETDTNLKEEPQLQNHGKYTEAQKERFNQYIEELLQESVYTSMPKPTTLKETLKEFLEDVKQAIREISNFLTEELEEELEEETEVDHKSIEEIIKKLSIEDIFKNPPKTEKKQEDKIEEVMQEEIVNETIKGIEYIESYPNEKKLPIYSKQKTKVLCENIAVEMSRIEKKFPEELIIKISCNPNAKSSNTFGKNDATIFGNLEDIDIPYLVEICDKEGMEITPIYNKNTLTSIDFVRDYRTEAEKETQVEMQEMTVEQEESMESFMEDITNIEVENAVWGIEVPNEEIKDQPVKKKSIFNRLNRK